MSMTPKSSSSTAQMPFEFGVPIDPGFRKVLQSRIRTLLQAKMEGFPGTFPVLFEQSHLQNLTSEEYFVMEKVAGVRYMLLSTITPKGPACFLIDRHFEISFVPQLLLPLRDNPAKYQNETLLDGEMILESDSTKKTLRFLVFDLMVLNGTVVTQRSYSTRLGMMDQDILAVQSNKAHDIKSKEPFTIERKTMQRSYGLNIILSGSKRHKHGGEGLIFVPVKRPYVPGTSSKLLKWKSNVTAQFQVKVTQSKERKPLYCIHTRQGTGNKFYDYVTPEPSLAVEWDAQWPTQMFEKGYGLETRTGGWRFYRIREDKKEADEEATLQAVMKSQESSVTKEQLESQIDTIRTQWKAREHSGGSSNGGLSQPGLSSQRPSMRPLTITNNSRSSSLQLASNEHAGVIFTPTATKTTTTAAAAIGRSLVYDIIYIVRLSREQNTAFDFTATLSTSNSNVNLASDSYLHPFNDNKESSQTLSNSGASAAHKVMDDGVANP
ncbi:Dcp1p-Dcp2p decapping enzyme complex alpha subunit [Podila clonocystis]|nr:Dcp1p-Dcp2p decapping enzyme complex alpha subunit [Podila clonocystis]